MAVSANQHSLRLMGVKKGMIQLFDEQGFSVVCTVVEVEPNVIAQIKTAEKDGYNALQMAYGAIQTQDPRTVNKRVSKPRRGHFQKANVAPHRHLFENPVAEIGEFAVGQTVSLDIWEDETLFDVTGTTIGKGYQGGMKKFGFGGGRASHGNSRYHRGIGSTGMRSTPGRCLPGGKRASQMGNHRKTVQNVSLYSMNKEKGLLLLRGQIPGPKGGLLSIRPAVKKRQRKGK